MIPVKMHQAKTDFSKLIARVEKGEEIIIARGDTPVAKIVPLAEKLPVSSLYGAMKGKIFMPDSFFDPLVEEENAGWEDDGLLGPPA